MHNSEAAVDYKKSIAIGKIRIQFYSEKCCRVEYSEDACFRDRPTAVVVNRNPIGANIEHINDTVAIGNDIAEIQLGDSIEELKISWNNKLWQYGNEDDNNLGGTLRALDGACADKIPSLGNGVLSRNKYFVLDDSHTPAYDKLSDKLIPQNNNSYKDFYFFIYDDYPEALRTYAALTGNVPMIPKKLLGLWFSRYYPYTQQNYVDIVKKFDKLGIPLDVIVMDVDWHLCGWEGFDWNKKLIQNPAQLLNWFHKNDLATSLNIHPGLLPDSDTHADEARKTLKIDKRQPVKFNLADNRQSYTYLEMLHRNLMDIGVDFWWIDGNSAEMDGLDSQLWTNKIYYNFTKQYSNARPAILSRFGGPGSQRYPIGFSGDTKSDWAVLQFEVKFTATAGNMLMGYWSHDIGGFCGNHIDTQLYIRWIQFGAMSPFLRLHSDHGDRAPWEYGEAALQAFRKAYNLRLSLIPYIYSMCYKTSVSSVPLIRPMYFMWPDDENSYKYPSQYMFGDSLLVRPVTHPSSEGLAHVELYLPEGKWYDFNTDELFHGNQTILYSCPMEQIPIFVRAGAIIPTQDASLRAGTASPQKLTIHIYSGADGSFDLYEDDGKTQATEKGEYSITHMQIHQNDQQVSLFIKSSLGDFNTNENKREFEIVLHGILSPSNVTANNRKCSYKYDTDKRILCTKVHIDGKTDTLITFDHVKLSDKIIYKHIPDTAIGLIQGKNGGTPKLQLSATAPMKAAENIHFDCKLPNEWHISNEKYKSNNILQYDLLIPKHMNPSNYKIEAFANIENASSSAVFNWKYSSVTDFLILGMFDNTNNDGMYRTYGPELDFGHSAQYDGRSWKIVDESAIVGDVIPVRYIDLTKHFGPICDVTAYAVTYIHTEAPRSLRFDFGSDDGLIAWLNGKQILNEPKPGPAAPAQFMVPVELKAGWNQVMLKIGQLYGDWGFYFEIKTRENDPAEGIIISTDCF